MGITPAAIDLLKNEVELYRELTKFPVEAIELIMEPVLPLVYTPEALFAIAETIGETMLGNFNAYCVKKLSEKTKIKEFTKLPAAISTSAQPEWYYLESTSNVRILEKAMNLGFNEIMYEAFVTKVNNKATLGFIGKLCVHGIATVLLLKMFGGDTQWLPAGYENYMALVTIVGSVVEGFGPEMPNTKATVNVLSLAGSLLNKFPVLGSTGQQSIQLMTTLINQQQQAEYIKVFTVMSMARMLGIMFVGAIEWNLGSFNKLAWIEENIASIVTVPFRANMFKALRRQISLSASVTLPYIVMKSINALNNTFNPSEVTAQIVVNVAQTMNSRTSQLIFDTMRQLWSKSGNPLSGERWWSVGGGESSYVSACVEYFKNIGYTDPEPIKELAKLAYKFKSQASFPDLSEYKFKISNGDFATVGHDFPGGVAVTQTYIDGGKYAKLPFSFLKKAYNLQGLNKYLGGQDVDTKSFLDRLKTADEYSAEKLEEKIWIVAGIGVAMGAYAVYSKFDKKSFTELRNGNNPIMRVKKLEPYNQIVKEMAAFSAFAASFHSITSYLGCGMPTGLQVNYPVDVKTLTPQKLTALFGHIAITRFFIEMCAYIGIRYFMGLFQGIGQFQIKALTCNARTPGYNKHNEISRDPLLNQDRADQRRDIQRYLDSYSIIGPLFGTVLWALFLYGMEYAFNATGAHVSTGSFLDLCHSRDKRSLSSSGTGCPSQRLALPAEPSHR